MTTDTVKKVTYVSSKDFQSNFEQSNKMNFLFNFKNNDTFAIQTVNHAARTTIPYGRWTCGDGSEVIFNREYQPMFKRVNGESIFVLPDTWVNDIVKVEFFYGDHNNPVSYVLRKFKGYALDISKSKECRRSLIICLKILEDYFPKNKRNCNQSWRSFEINI